MFNKSFLLSKKNRYDEFYTQYKDVEEQIEFYLDYNQNFLKGKKVLLPCDNPDFSNFTKYFLKIFFSLKLKELIATSFSNHPKRKGLYIIKTKKNETKGSLSENGDFRNEEIKKFRDNADIIITNPPYSLFKDFMTWIFESKKKFIILGNMNFITYKVIFDKFKDGELWLGKPFQKNNAYFTIPQNQNNIRVYSPNVFDEKKNLIKFRNCCWFTNVDCKKTFPKLELLTMKEIFKRPKHESVKKNILFKKYDQYNAIEVPFVDCIPSDYNGIMGVPVSYIFKHCPEQFEILGLDRYIENNPNYGYRFSVNGKEKYARILIRKNNKR